MGLGSALIRSATLFRQATTGENDGKHVKACSLKCVVGIDVGLTSNMTQTSPGVYTTDYYTFGSVTLRAVVNAASSPKSLAVTESKYWGGCRWSAVAP
jgi:hypothetical protein